MSPRILPSGDVVTVFVYRLGKSRAECSCGFSGKTRVLRAAAIQDAWRHSVSRRCGQRCLVDFPLVFTAEKVSVWRWLTPAPLVAAMPLLIAPAAILLAPVVHATPIQDSAYLSTLDQYGVYYSSESAAVTVGYSVCNAFDDGASFGLVQRTAVRAGMTDVDAAYTIGAAIGAYCPEHADVLGVPSAGSVA
jgi:hypothetical protein